MTNKKITKKPIAAVFFGGKSVEHDISVITGLQTAAAMSGICETIRIYIDRNGTWRIVPFCFDVHDLSSAINTKKLPECAILSGGRLCKKGLFGYRQYTKIDMAVLCFHGGRGEGGGGAGFTELLDVPCLNSSPTLHSVAMDKPLTKLVAKALDIPVLPHVVVEKHLWQSSTLSEFEAAFDTESSRVCDDSKENLDFSRNSDVFSKNDGEFFSRHEVYREEIKLKANELSYPLIVKPTRSGSSIGVTCVHNETELDNALEIAFSFGTTALIEPKLDGAIELNCACAKIGGKTVASEVEKPIGRGEILDFADKYVRFGKKGADRIFPYPTKHRDKIRQATIKLYDTLYGKGTMRADFFQCGEKLYLNEINAIPGSMAGYLFEEELPTLMKELYLEEQSRHYKNSELISYIETSVLGDFPTGGKLSSFSSDDK